MPIVSNLVQNPSPQDRIDIHKIFKDYPEPVTPEDVDAWLDAGELYAASFNDRLLGACRLVAHADHWQVDFLCVRAVTRRRGVAYKLLLDLQQLAQQSNRTLFCHVPAALDSAATHLVHKMGLTAGDNNQYCWSPDANA
jgi:ribosomal protein S18 acetylase RimI-like enzyme